MQIEKEYADLREQAANITLPPMADILQIISSRALLNSDIVGIICGSKMEEKRREQEKNDAVKYESLKAKFVLPSDSGKCLVTNTIDSSCVVTVGDFNTYISLQRPLDESNIVMAREQMLSGMLRTRFFAEIAKKEKLAVQKEIADTRHFIFENFLLDQNDSKEDISNGDLLAMYKKYYKRFFCDRKIKKVAVIGSTDSAFIDSIYQEFVKISNVKLDKRSSEQKSFITSLPWVVSLSEGLPEDINTIVDTLKIQGFCKIQLPFGYFFCRVISDQRQLEIRPEEAENKLRYLVTEERKRSGGKPDSVRAIEFYNSNSVRFHSPDTLQVKTWLVPTREHNVDSQNTSLTIKSDTTKFKSKVIASCTLPQEIKSILQLLYKEKNSTTFFAGPVSSRFGNWYFMVEKVKKGGSKIPFDSVKSKILDELLVQDFPLGKILKTDEGKHLFQNEVLFNTVYSTISSEIDSLPEKELEKLIKDKSVDVDYTQGDTISKGQFFLARFKLKNNRYADLGKKANEWINSLVVDKDLLRSGVEK